MRMESAHFECFPKTAIVTPCCLLLVGFQDCISLAKRRAREVQEILDEALSDATSTLMQIA